MKNQDRNAVIFFTIILITIVIVRVLTPILHK
jgi:hypothetical protein